MDASLAMNSADAAACARAQIVVEFEAPNRASAISRIRSRVLKFARGMHFTSDDLDDICIAVGEACTNAVKYAKNPNKPRIGIRMECHYDRLKVSISDAGPGFDPSKICPPDEGDLRECGRGIMCMRALMDEVEFYSLNPGTRVEMIKCASDISNPLHGAQKPHSQMGA